MSDVFDYATPPVGGETSGSRWGWAAYLGASWTWCIGMFLPVLLIRDYGPWAWVIFAVPNVVGAAAMGWVMRSQAMSRQYTDDHASACRLFSFVTIAFQLFFSIWMLPRLVGPVGYIGAAILIQSAFTPVTRLRWLRFGGWLALGVSIVAFAGINSWRNLLHVPDVGTTMTVGDGIGLLAVCLAGFLLCPYLDLTFHRARIETDDSSARVAFGVGFCVLFFSMVLLTLFYASDLRRVGLNASTLMSRAAMAWLALHFIVQMTYTAHAHAAELVSQAKSQSDEGVMRGGLGVWLAVGLAAGLFANYAGGNESQRFSPSAGESIYRVFMSFYGLLFPAYVLLAIGRRQVAVLPWLIVAAAASPFYWLAFLEAKMAWATVGVAVLVAGVLVARAVTRPASTAPTG